MNTKVTDVELSQRIEERCQKCCPAGCKIEEEEAIKKVTSPFGQLVCRWFCSGVREGWLAEEHAENLLAVLQGKATYAEVIAHMTRAESL